MHLRTLVTVGALVGALLVSSAARASLPPPSAPPAVAHFWTALEPYGTWIDAPGIGWCWQPSVAVVGAGWTPYTRGHWVYADVGWTWVSDFGWGWAPFHYGGWVDDAVWGWVWVPGDIWTPAWVEWRVGGGYVGWAPRPPASLPHPRAVVVGAPRGWTFVAAADFLAPNVYVRAVAPLRVNAVFAMTRPIVEARFVGGARVFVGPPLPFIRAHAGVPITPVPLVELHARAPLWAPHLPPPVAIAPRPIRVGPPSARVAPPAMGRFVPAPHAFRRWHR